MSIKEKWKKREAMAGALIANTFEKIATLFPPGSLLTFVMRNPGIGDDYSLIISDDNLTEVGHVLFRRSIEEPEDIESDGGRI